MATQTESYGPLVSIITVNYNNAAVTCDLLRSITRNTYRNVEVIVVDNASAEDPTTALKAVDPAVKVIRSEKNLGFSGGNNLGLRAALGEYLFLVNNDTEFTDGLIEGLLELFAQYPDAGIASPKFHYYFHKGTIEYAGYQAVDIFTGRNGMVGCKEPDNGQYDKVTETNYAHGGGMMIPARVLQEVGLMPEIFFLYYEEFDWCEQIKRKGYKVYYQYKSLIYHKESMTTGKNSPLKTYYITRNRILFMRRNVKLLHRAVFMCYLALFTIPKNTLTFLLKREHAHLKAFWNGLFWNIKNIKKVV
ncbi:glycosyltransferase family 2 protein [Chitinophaga lutea]|uniref:Glycosyltransferase family 2 protein n=1 Tax=Chitinophaga lutea TaxID=2488634 RepID=A0A3N4PNX6_9BACT|nr:glycosyltransferase family 2 protein [Chitinophaga lutea]RPE08359.1 glycosyltransferase family 2 protein [Chitinophaga lutea]